MHLMDLLAFLFTCYFLPKSFNISYVPFYFVQLSFSLFCISEVSETSSLTNAFSTFFISLIFFLSFASSLSTCYYCNIITFLLFVFLFHGFVLRCDCFIKIFYFFIMAVYMVIIFIFSRATYPISYN